MIQRRHFVVSSCAATVGVCAAARARDTSGALRLGQSLPLSGPHAVLGTAVRASAMATFAELARTDSSSSVPRIELISLDDGGQPERTAVNVKLLATEHRVQALFGFVGSGADRVGSRAAVTEGLPYVAPVSGSVELRTSRSPGTFTFRASHAEEIRYIAKHAETIGVTRLALVYEYNFLGWELRDTVLDLLEAGGNRQVALTSVDREGSAYSMPGAVEAVLTKQPQAIILGSNAVASAAFVRAARSAGFKGYLYALSSVGSQGLGEQLGPLVSGISVTQVVPFALSGKTEVSRNHRAFCSRHRIEPSSHSMEAWIGATLFVASMKRMRGTGAAAIVDALTASAPLDFGNYEARWYASQSSPKAYVSLAVYDRHGRLIE